MYIKHVKQKNRCFHEICVSEFKSGDVFTILNISDVHLDSKGCDEKLLKRHLDRAVEDNALIFSNGDQVDAMQGRYDPRRASRDLQKKFLGDNYIDKIVDYAIDFYGEYANNFFLMGQGNHERSILKNLETDPLERIVQGINTKYQPFSPVFTGGYAGWISIKFEKRDTKLIKYHHGSGKAGRS
jgi:hypothetical protein